MKEGLTEIVCVVDRSGSMANMREEAKNGFNDFLKKQKEVPGEANLTLVLFDHEYIVMHDGKPLQSVEELTDKTYVPRGTTALWDAIGRAVTTVGERLDKTPEHEKAEKVIVVILTDGYENASQEYSGQRIRGMIDLQRKSYSWEFVFLAANQDAVATAQSMNIPKAAAMNFAPTGEGVKRAYACSSSYVRGLRTSGKGSFTHQT
jgi:uncharacterized protein YegL